MDRERAAEFMGSLHRAQEELYAGGDADGVRSLLSPEIVWQVPGQSAIAGRYEGIEEVIGYMRRRRDLAGRTFRMHRRELLVGEGEHIAALTDGTAVIGGRKLEWSTIGLYRLRDRLLLACRLIPFDQAQFDSIWSGAPEARSDD